MSLNKEIIPGIQETEVSDKKARRRFTADEKRRIVALANACTQSGELTALLRREGIYWTYLSNWRRAFKKDGLVAKRRGPKPMTVAQRDEKERVLRLEKQLAQMTARAERAESLVDLQKKIATLLGTPLNSEVL